MNILTVVIIICSSISSYSIPEKELSIEKIYFGSGTNFGNPAELDYQKIIGETPEYKEIIEKKMEAGTGKYWILLSQASDRVVKSIQSFATANSYDLIASIGYLSSLTTPIPSINITSLVINLMTNPTG